MQRRDAGRSRGPDAVTSAGRVGSRRAGSRGERKSGNRHRNGIRSALVSDIVAYHPERRERALSAGTLRMEFKDEILKSWNEYVEQVGESVARETPWFRDALNEVLAGGEKVF